MTAVLSPPILANPYPGLRPFDERESDRFFGRETHVDELLRRLGRARFLAVVGTSGSGKSSLVRAGLLPALNGGGLVGASSHWRIAVFRPGGDPVEAMATALHAALGGGSRSEDEGFQRAMLDTTLRRSSLGLIEATRLARLPPDANVLLVVDQFEELFRFKRAARVEAGGVGPAGFVRLLLEAIHQMRERIHVVITMRSDFFGDCAEFDDLAETINDGLFLIPRMTRDQLRLAIRGPAAVAGVALTPGLVQQLLNDVGDDPDQLPVLQHALMRTWERWAGQGSEASPIDLGDYEAIGGMAHALSRHADEALEALSDAPGGAGRDLAKRVFQVLTERGPDNREVRRPTRLGDIDRILAADRDRVEAVIECFRAEGRTFLMPPWPVPLQATTVIDISHESLIRKWDQLATWVEEEAGARETYVRLAEAAALEAAGKAGLWRDPELHLAQSWRERTRPTSAWAERYDPAFETAMRFLDRSAEEQKRVRRRERRRRLALMAALSGGLLASVAALVVVSCLYERTLASQHASQAVLLSVEEGATLHESVQRAVESLQLTESVEANSALQRGLALLPEEVQRVPLGQDAKVVAISPDGRHLATGNADGTVTVMDAAIAQSVAQSDRSVDAGRTPVVGAASGPAASRCTKPDPATGSEVTQDKGAILRGHTEPVVALAFSPDGGYVVTGSEDTTARIWDAARGTETCQLRHEGPVAAVAASPDGRYVATGSSDGTARVWLAGSGEEVRRIRHPGDVGAVAFSRDARLVATGSGDGTVRVTEIATGRSVSRRVLPGSVRAVTFGPDESMHGPSRSDKAPRPQVYVATRTDEDNAVGVLSLESGAELAHFVHEDTVLAVAFSRDGRSLMTGSDDRTARVIESATGRQVSRAPHDGPVRAVAFAPDGLSVVTVSGDRNGPPPNGDHRGGSGLTARVLKPEWLRHLLDGRSITAAALSGRLVATASADGAIRVTDAITGSVVHERTDRAGAVQALSFSEDGRYLAIGQDGGARIVVADTGEPIGGSRGVSHDRAILAVALSRDGRYLVSGSEDQIVKVLDTKTGAVRSMPHDRPVVSVAVSADGLVATGTQADESRSSSAPAARADKAGGEQAARTIRVIDAGDVTRAKAARLDFAGLVPAMALSPDGQRLVSGTWDGRVMVWDTTTGQRVVTLTPHRSAVYALAVSRDGRFLASGSRRGGASVWDLADGKEILHLHHPGVSVLAVAFDDQGVQVATTTTLHRYSLRGTELLERARARLQGYQLR